MKTVVLDGNDIITRADFHTEIAKVLDFPEWYGNNLDGLYDCLTDIFEDVQLRILRADVISENLETYWETIQIVFRDASEENEHFSYEICDIED